MLYDHSYDANVERFVMLGWGIETTTTLQEAVNDTDRVQYFHAYYKTISESIRFKRMPEQSLLSADTLEPSRFPNAWIILS
jgi:hypothetical protein